MNATPILPGLSPVAGKPLTATFDAGRLSSDGGVIVLREIAARARLGRGDHRPAARRSRPAAFAQLRRDGAARMLMIAAGYEDCDDVDALRPIRR